MISIEFNLTNWIDTRERVRNLMPAVISQSFNRAGDQWLAASWRARPDSVFANELGISRSTPADLEYHPPPPAT